MAGTEPSKLTLSRQWMQTRESPVVLTKAFFGLKLSSWASFFLGADLGFPLGQAILTCFVASIGWDIKDNFRTLFCQNLGRLNYFALPFFLFDFCFQKVWNSNCYTNCRANIKPFLFISSCKPHDLKKLWMIWFSERY